MVAFERASDRWVSAGLSVVLHGALIALLVYGWWRWHTASRPVPTLAINASVVSSRSVQGAANSAPPAHVTPPPSPPVTPPPAPPAEEQTVPRTPPPDQKVAEERQAEQARAEAERKMQAEAQRKADEEAERKEAQEQAQARAVAEEQQRLAEAKKKAEAQRKLEAQQKAEAQRRAAEAKSLAEDEDLSQSINADERAASARSGALATWEQLITARITQAWIRPPTARAGIDCMLYVTQVPGGQVTNAKLGPCNGDGAVRQSVIDAAYRASPLPAPPADAPFVRDLQIEFKPTD